MIFLISLNLLPTMSHLKARNTLVLVLVDTLMAQRKFLSLHERR